MKHCNKCNLDLSDENFIKEKKSKDGLSWMCKECLRLKSSNFYKLYKKDNPNYIRQKKDKRLQRLYNIDINIWEQILNIQNNKCRICNKIFNLINPNSIHVDHCHRTNRIRGLLCQPCNQALGLFEDNIEYMKSAINYIENQ